MRWVRPVEMSSRPLSPFRTSDLRQPSCFDRTDDNMFCGKINVVVIEGPSQSGKTTLGGWWATRYDPKPRLLYNAREALDMCKEYLALYREEEERGVDITRRSMLWKWNVLDEPQQEAPSAKWLDERAQVIAQIVNGYGFLKQNLVLTLPDLGDIGKRVYSNNLTYRIKVDVRKIAGKASRRAYFYFPYKPIWKDKWTWKDAGYMDVPRIVLPEGWAARKLVNFDEKLERWEKNLDRQERSDSRRAGDKPYDPYAPSAWSHK
ncbi:MAG: hypothetical protein NT016_01760 [Candidatus Aenigmarchaeota archaeon]|nr:hypothetical protein [Candidatus Aenigmarchaeota archaeon]